MIVDYLQFAVLNKLTDIGCSHNKWKSTVSILTINTNCQTLSVFFSLYFLHALPMSLRCIVII